MEKLVYYLFSVLLLSGLAFAEENISLPDREVTVKVNGAVCGFCSYGVRKAIAKLPFVDTAKYEKGIRTNSEQQSVTIAVLPGEAVDEEAIKEIVVDAGYETVSIEYSEE